MVTLTTDHGTFEAQTAREADKLAKKAAKVAAKAAAEREAKRQVARVRAESQAYRIVKHKALNESMPRGWAFYPVGSSKWAPATVTPGAERYDDDTVTIETGDGKGEMKIYHGTFLGSIDNGAGYTIAIVLRDGDYTPQVWAVGTFDGVASAEHISPAVHVDEFRKAGDPL